MVVLTVGLMHAIPVLVAAFFRRKVAVLATAWVMTGIALLTGQGQYFLVDAAAIWIVYGICMRVLGRLDPIENPTALEARPRAADPVKRIASPLGTRAEWKSLVRAVVIGAALLWVGVEWLQATRSPSWNATSASQSYVTQNQNPQSTGQRGRATNALPSESNQVAVDMYQPLLRCSEYLGDVEGELFRACMRREEAAMLAAAGRDSLNATELALMERALDQCFPRIAHSGGGNAFLRCMREALPKSSRR